MGDPLREPKLSLLDVPWLGLLDKAQLTEGHKLLRLLAQLGKTLLWLLQVTQLSKTLLGQLLLEISKLGHPLLGLLKRLNELLRLLEISQLTVALQGEWLGVFLLQLLRLRAESLLGLLLNVSQRTSHSLLMLLLKLSLLKLPGVFQLGQVLLQLLGLLSDTLLGLLAVIPLATYTLLKLILSQALLKLPSVFQLSQVLLWLLQLLSESLLGLLLGEVPLAAHSLLRLLKRLPKGLLSLSGVFCRLSKILLRL